MEFSQPHRRRLMRAVHFASSCFAGRSARTRSQSRHASSRRRWIAFSSGLNASDRVADGSSQRVHAEVCPVALVPALQHLAQLRPLGIKHRRAAVRVPHHALFEHQGRVRASDSALSSRNASLLQ
eukprot:6302938-Prymnesium_polylepis.1